MRYWILIVLTLMPFTLSAQNVAFAQATTEAQSTLIRSITIEGFLLQDKNRFTKLFKPYQNKHLSKDDMDMILQKIQAVYELEGFQQLVSITYTVNHHRLIYSVVMTS